MAKEIVTIPSRITKGEELIVIPRSLYEKFSRFEKKTKVKKSSLKTIQSKLKAIGKKISQKEIDESVNWARKKIYKSRS
jgi:uncharacterized protein (DUF1697 family)